MADTQETPKVAAYSETSSTESDIEAEITIDTESTFAKDALVEVAEGSEYESAEEKDILKTSLDSPQSKESIEESFQEATIKNSEEIVTRSEEVEEEKKECIKDNTNLKVIDDVTEKMKEHLNIDTTTEEETYHNTDVADDKVDDKELINDIKEEIAKNNVQCEVEEKNEIPLAEKKTENADEREGEAIENEEEEEDDDEDYSTEEEEDDEEYAEGEREQGDGEECISPSPAVAKPLDFDEDRRNPQYIPKKGMFYEHDDRINEDAEKEQQEDPTRDRKKKLWLDGDKWQHDCYREEEQVPKSRQELVDVYGYDIRNEDGPPRARRRRRYGHGPSKYDRNWEDDNAYRQEKFQSSPRGQFSDRRGRSRGGPRFRGGGRHSFNSNYDQRDRDDGDNRVSSQNDYGQNYGNKQFDHKDEEAWPALEKSNTKDNWESKGRNRDEGWGNRDNRDGGYNSRENRDGGYGSRDNRDGGYGSRDNRDGGYGSRDNRDGGYGSRDNRDGGYGSRDNRGRGPRGNRGGFNSRDNREGGRSNRDNREGGWGSRGGWNSSDNREGGRGNRDGGWNSENNRKDERDEGRTSRDRTNENWETKNQDDGAWGSASKGNERRDSKDKCDEGGWSSESKDQGWSSTENKSSARTEEKRGTNQTEDGWGSVANQDGGGWGDTPQGGGTWGDENHKGGWGNEEQSNAATSKNNASRNQPQTHSIPPDPFPKHQSQNNRTPTEAESRHMKTITFENSSYNNRKQGEHDVPPRHNRSSHTNASEENYEPRNKPSHPPERSEQRRGLGRGQRGDAQKRGRGTQRFISPRFMDNKINKLTAEMQNLSFDGNEQEEVYESEEMNNQEDYAAAGDPHGMALKGGDPSGRPKRYSSLRQRTAAEPSPYPVQAAPPVQGAQHAYYEAGFQAQMFSQSEAGVPTQNPQSQGAANAPIMNPAYQTFTPQSYADSYGIRLPVATTPPRIFTQVSVQGPNAILAQAPACIATNPPPNIINFAPPTAAPPPTYQYTYQIPPPPPQVQAPPPQPNEMYQPGITYYYPQNPAPPVRPAVQKRPKAAIPIMPPPERELKRGNKDSSKGHASNHDQRNEMDPSLQSASVES